MDRWWSLREWTQKERADNASDKRDDWPELRLMTSTGLPSLDEPGNIEAREPIGNEIIFMTPAEAHELWGNNVERMRGMTWLWNDGQCEWASGGRLFRGA